MNRISQLFDIKYPIISGGMVWCSGWRLATAVSNSGGLGLIGAGSMHPDTLREHIRKAKEATDRPFGVNVPLLYPQIDELMEIITGEGVKIVFTSAGNPMKWTPVLKAQGIKVAHVIANSRFARKCEEAGVDAIVAEGFEAGGHNGREETTTLALIPQIRQATTLPLIAAGGIAGGRAMLAVMALGAEGIQAGTRFALSEESSAHEAFKRKCISLNEGDTILSLKKLSPTRLIKNEFYRQIEQAENAGAPAEELANILGRGRAKRGIFEGDLEEGELEIGQVASMIRSIKPAGQIIAQMIAEYNDALENLRDIRF